MMRRGDNFLSSTTRNRNRNRNTSRIKGSDDDDDGDEDYVFDEDDDDDDDSDVPKGFLVSSSSDDDHLHLHLEKEKKKKMKRKPPLPSKSSKSPSLLPKTRRRRSSSSSSKRTKLSDEEDYDFDQPDTDDDDDNDFNPDEEDELHLHTSPTLTKKKIHQISNTNLLITMPGTSHAHYTPMPHTSKTQSITRRRNNTPLQHSHSHAQSDQQEELLREANHFILNSTRNSSLHLTPPSNYHPPKPKPKPKPLKVTSLQGDTTKQVCGICFSEEAKGIVRGSLNCCSHYFCFACIIEWSKVESRCPFCKQRFVAISKPARSYLGVHLRTTVIQVPKRDQVYQPSEEELRDFLDPYDGVVCMECQLGGDDCLMLLCDICDSPAHTYCVGLGREVPEGNWYCKGCRISEPGPPNVQVQDLSQGTSNSGIPTYLYGQRTNLEDTDPIPQSTVSVSESMNEIGVHLSPRHSVADDGHLASPSGLGVSTLSGRRRIHRQIRNLISSTRMSQRIETPTQTEEGNVESEAVPNSEVEQIGKPNTQHEASSGFNSFVYDFWAQDGNPSSVDKEISSPYV